MPLTILLRCHDLEVTRLFYRSVSGFHVRDTAAGTITVEHRGGNLVFTTEDLWGRSPALSGTLYFAIPDVDGYYESVRHEVPLAWPLQDMPYGSREFGIEDCNGYYLAFQQQV